MRYTGDNDEPKQKFDVSNNLIFRGIVILMFLAILAMSGFIGSGFLNRLDRMDRKIDDLNDAAFQVQIRLTHLEDKVK